jgi:hypothetical protein
LKKPNVNENAPGRLLKMLDKLQLLPKRIGRDGTMTMIHPVEALAVVADPVEALAVVAVLVADGRYSSNIFKNQITQVLM